MIMPRPVFLRLILFTSVLTAFGIYSDSRYQVASADQLTASLQMVNDSFSSPIYVTHAGDTTNRLFIAQQGGQILIIDSGQVLDAPFLNLSAKVANGSEQGLLGIAFPPDYAYKGYFYVNYTRKSDGATVIARFYVSLSDPNIADPTSEDVILIIHQPFSNHNGGHIAFSPNDGYLYIATGDGGGGGDPLANAQSRNTLLGKILRIDVETLSNPLFPLPPIENPSQLYFPSIAMNQPLPYLVPQSNPFVNDANAQGEIWSYGLRNPWRFSFDRLTGDIYIADVGQQSREEVDYQASNSTAGANYGWSIMEGSLCYNASTCDATGLILPIAEYAHDEGCSITGGYIYRGVLSNAMEGIYFYGDYCSGKIWGLKFENSSWQVNELLDTSLQISSFGEDEAGEIYLLDHSAGILYRIEVP